MLKCVERDVDQIILESECVAVKVNDTAQVRSDERRAYLVNKKAVIERDTDLLGPDELLKHRAEVAAAIVAELKTWHH